MDTVNRIFKLFTENEVIWNMKTKLFLIGILWSGPGFVLSSRSKIVHLTVFRDKASCREVLEYVWTFPLIVNESEHSQAGAMNYT